MLSLLQAGASTGFVGKIIWQVTASISLRASAKLGTMGIELELGGSHRVSSFSTAGCSVVAGVQVIKLLISLLFLPETSESRLVLKISVELSNQTVTKFSEKRASNKFMMSRKCLSW